MFLKDVAAIEVQKNRSEKLVVKPCLYGGRVNLNLGIQALGHDGRYRYRQGGFNLGLPPARELVSALQRMVEEAEHLQIDTKRIADFGDE